MKYFVVKDGVIVNIIEADNKFEIQHHEIHVAGDVGDIGHKWQNGAPVVPSVKAKTFEEISLEKTLAQEVEFQKSLTENSLLRGLTTIIRESIHQLELMKDPAKIPLTDGEFEIFLKEKMK